MYLLTLEAWKLFHELNYSRKYGTEKTKKKRASLLVHDVPNSVKQRLAKANPFV
jgi:hypothetical protein